MRRRVLPAIALCLLLCACATAEPEPTDTPAPTPSESASPSAVDGGALTVYTDWSKLGDREEPPEPVGSRWYEEYTGELIPREDYGPLIPYAGLRLMDSWPAENGCLYGLMTQEGVAVTEPVYSRVYSPRGYGEDGEPYTHPLLVLEQGGASADEEAWDLAVYAVAAWDGSWCTPFDYRAVTSSGRGLLLFQPDSVTEMTPEGALLRTWTVEEMGISQSEFDAMLDGLFWGEGWCGERRGDYMALGWEPESDYTKIRSFDLVSGGVRVFSMEEWDALMTAPDWARLEKEPVIPEAVLLQDSLLGYGAPGLLVLTEYTDTSAAVTYYREDGTPLPQLTVDGSLWYQRVNVVGGLIEVLDRDLASYYDLETLACVFRTYLGYEGD